MVTRAYLRIYGKVQGVFYRASAAERAEELGLDGWVRNCSDGSVEALIAGASEKVDSFITWAWRGPPQARVERVEVDKGGPDPGVKGFGIRR